MTASTGFPTWAQVEAEFQRIWGYDAFRPPQDTIIRALLDQRDALVVLPTGGGKSLCFQLPALLQRGVTLVVSPLVALMEDQVQDLQRRGLPAAALHSEQVPKIRRQVLAQLERQQLRLLYVSPEGLLSPPVWSRLQNPALVINGLVLDEAHCLVQWGDSFRPAYRRLGAARAALLATRPEGTSLPVAAFTATADPLAQGTIAAVLGLVKPWVVRLSPYRPNLYLAVKTVWTPQGRLQALDNFIQSRRRQPGLVYVRTRRDSEQLAQRFQDQGYPTAAYHGGLPGGDRRQREAQWLRGELQFVVSTNAFGMGVNKADVRWVAHFHVPHLLAEYVQEVGRAGRDGQRAVAMALVSERTGLLDPSDRQRFQFFAQQQTALHQRASSLARALPPRGKVAAVQQEFPDGAIALGYLHSQGALTWLSPFEYQLCSSPQTVSPAPTPSRHGDHEMTRFLHSKTCRWRSILGQFGFGQEAKQLGTCGHCDRCRH